MAVAKETAAPPATAWLRVTVKTARVVPWSPSMMETSSMEKLAVSSLARVPLRGAALPMVYAAESVSVSVMVSSGSRI